MVRSMFDAIAPRYGLLNGLITFGLDRRWRRAAADALGLGSGARVLDLACGTGDLSRLLVKRQMRPVGVDISAGMLQVAAEPHRTAEPHPSAQAGDQRHSDTHGDRRPSPHLVQGDASALPFPPASFDGVISGFALRNFSDLAGVFAEVARVLRPQGRISLLEVDEVRAPVLRTVHGLWFDHAVPAIGGLLSDPVAYRYLPRSVAYLPPAPAMEAMAQAAGFAGLQRQRLTFGTVQILTATRR